MKRSWKLGLGCALGMALAVILWSVGDTGPMENPNGQQAPPQAAGAAPFVPSQQGTLPDGNLRANSVLATAANPHALAYGELRRLFDYYLSALGEQDLPAIIAQIHTQLDQRLKPDQVAPARRLLELYIAFKRALIQLDAKPELAGDAVAAIRKRMLAQQDLRTQYFSRDEIEGMFGFEDSYDADALDRLEVAQNPRLTPAQKQQKLAALDAAMPAALRAEREAGTVVHRVEQRAAEMRAQGASDDEVYRMRAKAFDPEAAARLAALDQEEAAWKRRVSSYLEARAQWLKSNPQASVGEREEALVALQQRLFTADEVRRLVAYEPSD